MGTSPSKPEKDDIKEILMNTDNIFIKFKEDQVIICFETPSYLNRLAKMYMHVDL